MTACSLDFFLRSSYILSVRNVSQKVTGVVIGTACGVVFLANITGSLSYSQTDFNS